MFSKHEQQRQLSDIFKKNGFPKTGRLLFGQKFRTPVLLIKKQPLGKWKNYLN